MRLPLKSYVLDEDLTKHTNFDTKFYSYFILKIIISKQERRNSVFIELLTY
jgi:hypothetical protein